MSTKPTQTAPQPDQEPAEGTQGNVTPVTEPEGIVPQIDPGMPVEQTDGNPEPATDDGAGQNEEQEIDPGHDPEAPFGRKNDGTPRVSRAGRPSKEAVSAAAQTERDKQRSRLRSVTQSKFKDKKPAAIDVTPALAVVNYQAMGETVANLWINAGVMVIGDDWQPEQGEPQALAGAFRDYFKATNVRDLPPGFALVAVLSIYTLKRAQKPTMRTKLAGAGAWLKQNLRLRR